MARMISLKRGMVVDVNLDPTLGSETGKIRPCIIVTNDVYNERVPVIQVVPITAWSVKKAKIATNVEIFPARGNGLAKRSIADCLQARPIDRHRRLLSIRGNISPLKMKEINQSLRIVFELN